MSFDYDVVEKKQSNTFYDSFLGSLVEDATNKKEVIFSSCSTPTTIKVGADTVQGFCLLKHPDHGDIFVSFSYFINGNDKDNDKETRKAAKKEIKNMYDTYTSEFAENDLWEGF